VPADTREDGRGLLVRREPRNVDGEPDGAERDERAPAPPAGARQAPAKPDTDTPANEEAETAADAAEGEPKS
jgi:hypothetical protein